MHARTSVCGYRSRRKKYFLPLIIVKKRGNERSSSAYWETTEGLSVTMAGPDYISEFLLVAEKKVAGED